ncbi:MAG: hypothetical protein QM478_13145 [Flavobacteriaceae bacterium]
MRVRKELKFGILQTLAFYIFGLVAAWFIYMIFGNPYIHAPGIHHITIFLTFLIGFIWMIISLLLFFGKKKTDKLKGVIITNLILILIFIMYLSSLS